MVERANVSMASSSPGRTLGLLIDLFRVLELILNGLMIRRTFSWAKLGKTSAEKGKNYLRNLEQGRIKVFRTVDDLLAPEPRK